MSLVTPFWRGEFSQWYMSKFTWKGRTFTSCEQWMMFNKAIVFGDNTTAQKILDIQSPKVCKSLGRSVKNFDNGKWQSVKLAIVIRGAFLKYSQNEKLKRLLLETGDEILCEASPYDNMWGVGLSENNPDHANPCRWKGTNLLGQALMIVRYMLKNDLTMNDNFDIIPTIE